MSDFCENNVPTPSDCTTPPQIADRKSEDKVSTESPTSYTFDDFPITKRENLNVSSYKLDLVYTKRSSSLAVRLKLGDCIRLAVLDYHASEKEIRKAAKALEYEVLNSAKTVINKESLPYLKTHFIVPLETESLLFPEAIYFCELCGFHMNNIHQARAHLEQYPIHVDGEERFEQKRALLSSLPEPHEAHIMALNDLIIKEVDRSFKRSPQAPHNNMLEEIVSIHSKKLRLLLQECHPSKPVRLINYGSVMTKCDTINSNVNFMVDVDCHISKVFNLLSEFEKGLQRHALETGEISNIQFHQTLHPNITFTINDVEFVLSCNKEEHVKTSQLIRIFLEVCPELSTMLRLVRRWASIAGLDKSNKKKCGFGGFVFDIMVIHFLQRENLVPHLIDIFNGYVEEDSADTFATYSSHFEAWFQDMENSDKLQALREKLETKSDWNYASLFLQFLKFTVENTTEVVQIVSKKKLLRKETKIKVTYIQVQDPYYGDNTTNCLKAFQCYFLNCFLISYTYFSIPQTNTGPLTTIHFYQKLMESPRKKKKTQTDSKQKLMESPRKKNKTQTDSTQKLMESPRNIIKAQTDSKQKVQLKLREIETPKKTEAVGTLGGDLAVKSTPVQTPKRSVEDDDEIERWTKEKVQLKLRESETPQKTEAVGTLDGDLAVESTPVEPPERSVEDDDEIERLTKEKVQLKLRESETPQKTEAVGTLDGDLAVESTPVEPPERSVEDDDEIERLTKEKVQLKLRESETPQKTEAVGTLDGDLAVESTPVQPPKRSVEDDDEIERLTKELEKLQERAKVFPITEEKCIEYNGPNQYPKKVIMDINNARTYELNEEVLSNIKAWKIYVNPLIALKKLEITRNMKQANAPHGNVNKMNNDQKQVLMKMVIPTVETTDVLEEDLNIDNVCFEEFFMDYDIEHVKSIKDKCKSWGKMEYTFVFDEPSNYNLGFCPELKCSYCDKINHASENCPLTKVPVLVKYPKKSGSRLFELDCLILFNYEHEKLNKICHKSFAETIAHLTEILSEFMKQKVNLEIFGSLVNGFGSKESDLDICFTFANSPDAPEDRDPKNVIKQIYRALVRNRRFISHITRILMAKVPIVKFGYRYHSIELQADLSYYNCLALYNSKLLKTYCLYEPNRLPQLGLWVKKFAKVCDIGDASKGSLSSYSYIIMLIYYLQNCEPPVLPRLQEDFKTNHTLPKMVEGWDVYFHDKVVKSWSKNEKTVGVLFLGFLDFYSSFNFHHVVIQIRRKEELLKIEKRWYRAICIEDPFDHSHNLGNVVSSKMFLYIQKTFIHARNIFNSESVRSAYCKSIGKNAKDKMFPHEIPYFMDFLMFSCNTGHAPPPIVRHHHRPRANNTNGEENNKQKTPRRQTHEDAGHTNVKEKKNQTSTPHRHSWNKKHNNRLKSTDLIEAKHVASPRT